MGHSDFVFRTPHNHSSTVPDKTFPHVRYVNGHQLEHYSQSCHPLALSFSDLSVWCFDCDSYVDNQVLYKVKNLAHKDKFNGEEMLKPDYGEDGNGAGAGFTFELV